MTIFYNFLIGLSGALIGTIPPGLLNMYAVKVNFREGRRKALIFSAGVCVTIMLLTTIALIFAGYIDKHPTLVLNLQKIALVIFTVLTFYFFFFAKDTRTELPEKEVRSKSGRFFTGMLIASLNLLPLPFWVYVSLAFSGLGWFTFAGPEMGFAVIGSGMGTFLILFLYVLLSKKREKQNKKRMNINYLIGTITAVVAFITLLKIINHT